MQYTLVKMRFRLLIFSIAYILVNAGSLCALDLSDPYKFVSDIMDPLIDKNEGRTTFRSLLIPVGGRSEAMGSAFSALANDISFFETNPSGSATMKNTELAVFHNNWIQDSRLETLSYTQRMDDFGYGASLRCFYIPFTEYNTFGERASRGYYTETLGILNVAYNFFSGYYFKGISAGANIKAGYRSMPDFSDNYGNLIPKSGFTQSAFTMMADVGFQTRFNLFKLYASRDPNFYLGLTVRNFGPPVLGDPLPTVITTGAAYKPTNPITVSAEVQQPLNLVNPEESGTTVYGAGVAVEFARFFTFLGGFQLKGANPRISLGGELNVNDLQFNINYTLDMTTQIALFNRISLAAKLNLGDRGRLEKVKKIENLYIEGLKLYASGRLEEAILIWNEILLLDNGFDPAREGVQTASTTLDLQQKIKDLQRLE